MLNISTPYAPANRIGKKFMQVIFAYLEKIRKKSMRYVQHVPPLDLWSGI